MNSFPDRPNKDIINNYLKKHKTLEKDKHQKKSLNLLFNSYPENKEIEHILLKVSTLNDFYSTRIFDTYTVSKHILNCNIDKELATNSIALVNKIAAVQTRKGRIRKFYSFASKYCSYHKPEKYPIYDSYVDKMLWYFKEKDKFSIFKRKELKEYNTFLQIIESFFEFYNLKDFSLREVDIYLHAAGKEYFPNR